MPFLLNLLFRAVLLVAGLVFAAALLVAVAFLVLAWAVRAGWARLTGRPVSPFVMRMHPGDAFASMYRRAPQPSRTPRADAVRPTGRRVDVTDVEPKDGAY
jgi:hypothetical protein